MHPVPKHIARVNRGYHKSTAGVQGLLGESTGLVHRGGVVALTNDVLMGGRVVVVS